MSWNLHDFRLSVLWTDAEKTGASVRLVNRVYNRNCGNAARSPRPRRNARYSWRTIHITGGMRIPQSVKLFLPEFLVVSNNFCVFLHACCSLNNLSSLLVIGPRGVRIVDSVKIGWWFTGTLEYFVWNVSLFAVGVAVWWNTLRTLPSNTRNTPREVDEFRYGNKRKVRCNVLE